MSLERGKNVAEHDKLYLYGPPVIDEVNLDRAVVLEEGHSSIEALPSLDELHRVVCYYEQLLTARESDGSLAIIFIYNHSFKLACEFLHICK